MNVIALSVLIAIVGVVVIALIVENSDSLPDALGIIMAFFMACGVVALIIAVCAGLVWLAILAVKLLVGAL